MAPACGGRSCDMVLIAIGGSLGALARWRLSLAVDSRLGAVFPGGTLVVNLLGSFLLGFLMGSSLLGVFTREQRLFLATGFAGSFTTFSTLMYETLAYAREGALTVAVASILLNNVLGLLAVLVGYALAGAVYGG